MAEWIKRGEWVTVVSFHRVFEFESPDTGGFAFTCEENGSLIPDQYLDSWMPNYQACMTGVVDGHRVLDRGIERREHRYWAPGVLRCARCLGEVVIDMVMTNTCQNCLTCGQPEDFSWHLLTAERCEAYMQAHEGRSCANPSEHHKFEECLTDYNGSGQRLAPREQWGWDTGESLGEILASDWPIGVSRETWAGGGE